MPKLEFQKQLAERLYPRLRRDGFKGSGATLRKAANGVLHVFNVQGGSAADRCYVNLGAHLPFLPRPTGSTPPEASNIREYECAFRDRVEPPSEYGLGWPYTGNREEVLRQLVDEVESQGKTFFDRWARFPDSFTAIDPDAFAAGQLVNSANALTFALVWLHIGNRERAKQFARVGLSVTPERASGLRSAYQRILVAA